MKRISYLVATIIACTIISSCSSDDSSSVEPQTFDIRGKVEKGPFISGSEITIQPMNAKLQVLGNMFNTSITDDLGNFQLGSKEFTAPYAEFIANGYFFNEVSGELSNGTLSLRALVDLRNSATINVNILTHLKYARIKRLVTSGMSFDEANSQAQKELFEAFGLSAFGSKDASSFSITAGTDESAALIAISSLLLLDRTEAALTEYLAKLSEDFGRNGYFSDNLKSQINEDKVSLAEHLTQIKENIVERYDALGISVKVKELSHFFDWDNDGVAGNELLKSGEKVTLSSSSLNAPNEGGTFSIQINSPISVYLEPQVDDGYLDLQPDNNITTETMFGNGLYEGNAESAFADKEMVCEVELDEKTLIVTLSELQSKSDRSKTIPLYDYVGNVVAELEITQKGRDLQISVSDAPLLGEAGKQIVNAIAMTLAEGVSNYNIVEQFYGYNKLIHKVNDYIYPSNSYISKSWAKMYETANRLLLFKKEDASRLNVYGDYCNVLSALYYSNLVYGWGGVPYITDYNVYDQIISQGGVPAESPQNIFKDLKNNLLKAIENLKEKRNESVKDINGFFFASKDIARVLLANIYMYENDYDKAMPLLQKVIDNNFYKLDASTNFVQSDMTTDGSNSTNISVSQSSEVIFALLYDAGTRAQTNVTIRGAVVMPYITLSDVYLSLAECCYFSKASDKAKQYINDVVKTKSLTLSESDVLMQIKEVREQILLYSGTYFAFLKRSGIAKEVCDIEDYQLLFPIPDSEIHSNRFLSQNDGY